MATPRFITLRGFQPSLLMVELTRAVADAHHGQDEARMIDALAQWPEWWEWELELTPHLLKRMADRQFSEVDLRTMLALATRCEPEPDGRFVIYSQWGGRHWEVVVEPDYTDRVLLVITAYARE